MRPDDDITALAGIGPKKAEAYHRLGVFCVRDLLYLFPRDHQDRRKAVPIAELEDGQVALVRGTVVNVSKSNTWGKRGRILHVSISDGADVLDIVFFNAAYLADKFKPGREMYFYGRVGMNKGKIQMIHPESSEGEQGILPIYPLTSGISQREIRKAVRQALPLAEEMPDDLPADLVEENDLMPLAEALRTVHFPADPEALTKARERIVFEDLFILQTGLLMMKVTETKGTPKKAPYEAFTAGLPFSMTGAQEKALRDISADLESDKQMNRLLQGDDGSGKTAVAMAAVYKTVMSGYQAAFMAPTDILVRQHYDNFKRDLGKHGIKVACLSGSMSAAEKKGTLEDLADGKIDVIVGTHALIQEGVRFSDLGLVVTDEQHRFGVSQRMTLNEKGVSPDILVMTATPIPRTLAVILYGDMDVSVIDELPPGRKSIITKAVTEKKRDQVYDMLLDAVRAGGQAYVVCPLISESDAVDARSAEEVYEELKERFAGRKVDLLHGEMKKEDKDEIMRRFGAGETDVLVSTVVIEVGIDVANASVMVIENCERFGLAQMHQLRGRVGRGERQSYCILILGGRSDIAVERARVMCESSDGFYIAERDLDLRGPGEVFGTRQHGLPDTHIAGLISHLDVMEKVRDRAVALLREDPGLETEKNAGLKRRVEALYGDDMTMNM